MIRRKELLSEQALGGCVPSVAHFTCLESQGPCVAGRPHLGGSVRWAGSFSTSCISVALFFLLSSQQLQDLLRQNHVAYSSDDLLIICQAPQGAEVLELKSRRADSISSLLLSDVLLAII